MKPPRDKAYRAFIRTLPCLLCGSPYVDAAHTGGLSMGAGMGQKSSDLSCVPLCRACHNRYHALSERAWKESHGIDLDAARTAYQNLYMVKRGNAT